MFTALKLYDELVGNTVAEDIASYIGEVPIYTLHKHTTQPYLFL